MVQNGGSAFGGGPSFSGGRRTTGSGSSSDPFRAAPRRGSSGGGGGSSRRRSSSRGRAPAGGEVPSERQLKAIEEAGLDTQDFIPRDAAPRVSFARGGRTGSIPVSEGFARRVQELDAAGEFDRVQRRESARSTQRFARSFGGGGVSLAGGGQAAVTSEGEFVSGATTVEGARLVTGSGRDVTPSRRVGVVSDDSRRFFADRSLSRAPSPVRDFARGVERGVRDPVGTLEQQRVTTRGSRLRTAAPSFAEELGELSTVPASYAVSRGLRFATGAAGAVGRRVAPQATSRVSRFFSGRAGQGALGVGGAALTAPAAVTAASLPTQSQRERAFLNIGAQVGLFGAGFGGRGGAAASQAGRRAVGVVPEFGSVGSLSRSSPGQAARRQVGSALSRSPQRPPGFFESDVLSATPGSLAVRRTIRRAPTGFVRSSDFVGTRNTVGSVSLFGDRGRTTDQQLTLTFAGRGTRAGGFPQVTPSAAANIARSEVPRFAAFEAFPDGSRQRLLRRDLSPEPQRLSPAQLSRLPQLQRGFDRLLPSQQRLGLPPVRSRGLQTQLEVGVPAPRRRLTNEPDFGSRVGLLSSRGARRGRSSLLPTSGVFRFGRIISSLRLPPRVSSQPPTQRFGFSSTPRAVPQFARAGFFSSTLAGAGVSSLLRQDTALRSSQQALTTDLSAFDALEGFRFGTSQDQGRITRTDLTSRQATNQITAQRQTSRLGFGLPPLLGIPRTPGRGGGRGTPPPGINVPNINFGLSRRRSTSPSSTARTEEFTPSLVAGFLDIRGDRPSTDSLTGLELRPVTFR